jgi:hypothetical protein
LKGIAVNIPKVIDADISMRITKKSKNASRGDIAVCAEGEQEVRKAEPIVSKN